MDDAIVEDEVEEGIKNSEEIRNEDPFLLTSSVSTISSFLQVYGWYILITLGVLYYLYFKYRTKVRKLFEMKHTDISMHIYDREEVQKKHEGMDAARRKLQERYNMDAMRHIEEENTKQEEKRKDRIADWERHQEGKGYKSKTRFRDAEQPQLPTGSSSSQRKKIYKANDYNPLTDGGAAGSSYRPPPRQGGGKGG